MATLVVVLFWNVPEREPSDPTTPMARAPALVAVALFWLLPSLNTVGWLDDYFSADLYSGHTMYATVSFRGTALARLPPPLREYVMERAPDHYELSIMRWSFGELNLAPYPAPRVFRNVGRAACRQASDPTVRLTVYRRASWFSGPTVPAVFSCDELNGGSR
jgi:hypothetical protein